MREKLAAEARNMNALGPARRYRLRKCERPRRNLHTAEPHSEFRHRIFAGAVVQCDKAQREHEPCAQWRQQLHARRISEFGDDRLSGGERCSAVSHGPPVWLVGTPRTYVKCKCFAIAYNGLFVGEAFTHPRNLAAEFLQRAIVFAAAMLLHPRLYLRDFLLGDR